MAARGLGPVGEGVHVVQAHEPTQMAGKLLARAVARAERRASAPRLAIPGGSALACVGWARVSLGERWTRVRLTWVDERCVAPGAAESNRGAAYRAGALDAGHPPAEELPLFLEGETGAVAVARVEAALGERFEGALDVVLLGMGEDGHVASLFPGRPWPDAGRVAHVTSSPKPPRERITLTLPFLASAAEIILLAPGKSKRSARDRLLAADPLLPATRLRSLTLVTDSSLGAPE